MHNPGICKPISCIGQPTTAPAWLSSGLARAQRAEHAVTLAFTRYCNCQYCVVYIAITGGRGGTLYCAIVRAVTVWSGVPKYRVGARIIVLICAQRPRHKTISCTGQPSPGTVAYQGNRRLRVHIHTGTTASADFGAAIHPGVGGGTHRRRAIFERC